MTSEIEQTIRKRLKQLDGERDRLIKMLNLLVATDLVAQASKVSDKPKRKPTPKKAHLPFEPAPHAKPYTQAIYDALANGQPLTRDQVLDYVHKEGYGDVTTQQINYGLNHMKQTGRLTCARGLWRRKHARYQSILKGNGLRKDIPAVIDTADIQTKNREKILARLDKGVEEGRLTKELYGKEARYTRRDR